MCLFSLYIGILSICIGLDQQQDEEDICITAHTYVEEDMCITNKTRGLRDELQPPPSASRLERGFNVRGLDAFAERLRVEG